jgi:formate dehydrogenase major subunit
VKPGRRPEGQRRSERARGLSDLGLRLPANRKILYKRASPDPSGKPWSEAKKYVWWDAAQKNWTGDDVPDFVATNSPENGRARSS